MSQRSTTEKTLTPEQADLLREKHYGFVTTLLPDGSPQTTLVWVDTDGEHALFNTARGRIKTRNLEREPRLSLAVVDPSDPWRKVLVVRGRGELVDEGADEHIDRLAQKYLGQERYPFRQPGERRVTVRVHADKVTSGL
jgi:PPOX class probable F420-dependent enzyme